jgi:hypothetical protein
MRCVKITHSEPLLGVSWEFSYPNLSIKDQNHKYKTNFKLSLKPKSSQTLVMRRYFSLNDRPKVNNSLCLYEEKNGSNILLILAKYS